MKVILISNKGQIEALRKIQGVYSDYIVVLLDKTLKNEFNKLDNALYYEDIINKYKKWKECLKEEKEIFDHVNNIKINSKNVFKECLCYKKTSILDIDAIRFLSSHSNKLANLIFKFSVFESIIEEIVPNKVILLSPETDWEKVVKYICNKNSIKVEKRGVKFSLFKTNLSSIFQSFFSLSLRFLPYFLMFKNIVDSFKIKIINSSSYSENRDILLFLINKKYLDILIPLAKSIQKDNFRVLTISNNGFDGLDKLNNQKIPFRTIESYLTLNIALNSNKLYLELINRYLKLKKTKQFQIHKIENSFIEEFIKSEIEKSLILALYSLRNMLLIKRIVELNSAKLLFMTHFSENIVNSFALGCHDINIPVIGIHRGTSMWQPEHAIFLGDTLMVSGEQSKKIFENWGIEPQKIEITGFPIFDDLLEKLKKRKSITSNFRENLNIQQKSIVTYLTQSFNSRFGVVERLNEIKTVLNAFKQLNDVFLVIKVHPTEAQTEIYKEYAEGIGLKNYAIIYDGVPLDDILISSKIALTKNSTTGFNALIAGCKLITLNSNDSDNFFLNSNVAKNVESTDELITYIRNFLNEGTENFIDPKIKEFIEYHFYKLDCNSINRIKKTIYSMVKE